MGTCLLYTSIRLILEIRGCQPDAAGDLIHVALHQASGGDGRGADSDAGGNERTSGIVGDRVLIEGDINLVAAVLKLLTGNIHAAQIHQHQMVVCTAGQDLKALLLKGLCQGLGIL